MAKTKNQSYKMDKGVDPNGLQNYFYSNDLCQKSTEEIESNVNIVNIHKESFTSSNLNLVNLDYQIRFSLGTLRVEPIPEAPRLKLRALQTRLRKKLPSEKLNGRNTMKAYTI